MPVAGGIPNIQTLEHIDYVLGHLPAWRGKRRVRVLEACARRLGILRQADAIDAETLKQYRQKVLPKLAQVKRQAAREAERQAALEAKKRGRLVEQSLGRPQQEVYATLWPQAIQPLPREEPVARASQ